MRYRLGLALLLVGLCGLPATAAVTISAPFRGVTIYQRNESLPRPLRINVVQIDLADPGISFLTTPSNGLAPGETTAQTTRAFLTQQRAQLAINTSFFDASNFPAMDNLGLAASAGDVYSTFQFGAPALNLSAGNVATIIKPVAGDSTGLLSEPAVPYFNVAPGNEQIVTRGSNTAGDTALQPRSAVGITADRKLILFTVDGRQSNISEGMTTLEVADLMIHDFGVIDAMNFDGGGSTTLAIDDGTPRLLNTPVGLANVPNTERPVAQSLAVFAVVPEPAMSMLIIGGIFAVARRRQDAQRV